MKLDRLKRLELRKAWLDEARDFTPWLAKEENIALLGEILGLDLEIVEQEKNVGPFKADILCRDTITDKYVLIENQLEKTDHIHLGQILTYAAGLDAVTIIWISQKFTEEHRASLDWLNTITDEEINFFGLEIELYQIGESLPAPNFKIVSKPNYWTKSVKKSTFSSPLTETKLLQKEYWSKLKEFIENTKSIIKSQKPSPQHWTNFAIGKSHFHLFATVNTRENKITTALCMAGPDAKTNFWILKQENEETSKSQISPNIEWRELPDAKQSHVYLSKDADPTNKSDWENQHARLKDTLEKFYNFFHEKIKKLDINDYIPEEGGGNL